MISPRGIAVLFNRFIQQMKKMRIRDDKQMLEVTPVRGTGVTILGRTFSGGFITKVVLS